DYRSRRRVLTLASLCFRMPSDVAVGRSSSTMPAPRAQELLAKRRQHRGLVARVLPVARVAGERWTLRRLTLSPAPHPRVALGSVVFFGWIHRDVLRHAHPIARNVRTDAVGEQAVEDQQIAGLHRNVDDLEAGQGRPPDIAISGLRGDPMLEGAERFRHTLKAACLAVAVDE